MRQIRRSCGGPAPAAFCPAPVESYIHSRGRLKSKHQSLEIAMLDDTTKLMLGPILALIPILIWELAIKPSRTRRNLALLLMAEVELNLEEIAYYFALRDEDPNGHLANLLLPRGSFL